LGRVAVLFFAPGTGKTLIAREISRAFRAKNMHIINGPELLDNLRLPRMIRPYMGRKAPCT